MDLPVTTSNDTDSGGHSGDSPDWAFAAATKPRGKTAKELHLIFHVWNTEQMSYQSNRSN